jgi:hypothetical protein
LIAAFVAASTGTSFANLTDSEAAPGYRIVARDGEGSIAIPVETESKEEWLEKYGTPDVGITAETIRSNGSASYGRDARRWTINAVGYSTVNNGCGTLICYRKFTKSSGDFSYIGPGNLSQIRGSLKWWISGVNVSFSLPVGVGFSAAGSGIQWEPDAVSNTWREQLNYPGLVQINANIISGTNFQVNGAYRKGTAWYYVVGS